MKAEDVTNILEALELARSCVTFPQNAEQKALGLLWCFMKYHPSNLVAMAAHKEWVESGATSDEILAKYNAKRGGGFELL